MGNFEKLSVLVIVVIIVMILVVALYTWTDNPDTGSTAASPGSGEVAVADEQPSLPAKPIRNETPRAEDDKKNLMDRLFPTDGDWPLKRGGTEAKPETTKPPAAVTTEEKPTPPPTTPAATAPEFVEYVVKEGDTLGKIAQELAGGSSKWPEIVKANPGLDPERLRPNTKIKVPTKGALAATSGGAAPAGGGAAAGGGSSAKPGGTYRVGRGETLETISKKVYGRKDRWPDIWVANLSLLDDPSDIRQDMEIKLPR